MKRKVLIADPEHLIVKSLQNQLNSYFDIEEFSSIDRVIFMLMKQYKNITTVLVSADIFRENNYDLISRMKENILLRRIPVICIDCKNRTLSEKTTLYQDILLHGALGFFTFPLDTPIIINFIVNIRNLTENSDWRDAARDTQSIDYMLKHTYSGAACILELHNDYISIVRTNDQFEKEVFDETEVEEDNLESFFELYLDEQKQQEIRYLLQELSEDDNDCLKTELVFRNVDKVHEALHIRANIRLIRKFNMRSLFFCLIDNVTDLYEAASREIREHEALVTKQLQVIIQNFSGGITISYDDFGSIIFYKD